MCERIDENGMRWHPCGVRAIFALLPLALLAGCVAHRPFVSPALSSSLPDELYFMRGGFRPDEYRLTKEGLLIKSTFEAAYDRRRNDHWRTIDEVSWRTFERAVAALHIREWRTYYEERPPSIDGMGWKFTWADAQQVIRSSGVNAGPDARNPRKSVNAFGQQVTADELLGRAFAQLWESSHPLVVWPSFKTPGGVRRPPRGG